MAEERGQAEDFDVMESLIAVEGKRIVDAGCGGGALSRHLAEKGATVIALEPDPEQAAANRTSLNGDAITFHQTGAEAIPCGDRSVDGVIFSKSLHHVPLELMADALAEAHRVLRPGNGFLYALEPEADGTHTRVMLPFHDETRARLAARKALLDVARPMFRHHREIGYFNIRRFESYESFVQSMSGFSYNDYTRAEVNTPEVKALFEAGKGDDGYAFDQPMRVDLFVGPL